MGSNLKLWQLWVARILIGIVLFWNLDAAISFMAAPSEFVHAFSLEGIPGEAALRGTGMLFLMWQVPYIFAVLHPIKHRVSVFEALAMQSIGLIGESLIWMGIPVSYEILRRSILRFILFDGIGVILIIIALVLTKKKRGMVC
ncbi:MAG: hypothetical protein MUO40_12760 [Anaerolineaceae bacterium]|nr:hypothetical protein [Anaerolineaceae bacterium]